MTGPGQGDLSVQPQEGLIDALDEVLNAQLTGSGADPRDILHRRGFALPEGADVEVRELDGGPPGDERLARKKTCWEVCINVGVIKVCREKCS